MSLVQVSASLFHLAYTDYQLFFLLLLHSFTASVCLSVPPSHLSPPRANPAPPPPIPDRCAVSHPSHLPPKRLFEFFFCFDAPLLLCHVPTFCFFCPLPHKDMCSLSLSLCHSPSLLPIPLVYLLPRSLLSMPLPEVRLLSLKAALCWAALFLLHPPPPTVGTQRDEAASASITPVLSVSVCLRRVRHNESAVCGTQTYLSGDGQSPRPSGRQLNQYTKLYVTRKACGQILKLADSNFLH